MLLLLTLACSGPSVDDTTGPDDTGGASEPVSARFATFNVSMFRDSAGELEADLGDPDHEQALLAARIIGEAAPDVLLLNEFDYDAEGDSLRLFNDTFLDGAYAYSWVAPSNTGIASGHDLDNSGSIGGPGDAFGFGEYEGQYAFAVLSKHPLGDPRTFQQFLWRDLPDAWLPEDWFTEDELAEVRLSSKNHVDLPVQIGEATVHFLISHPTPPAFDGAEDRNGRRNHDEIAFWARYLDADADGWPVDDSGQRGGLAAGHFVIAGDLNADPNDGDSSGDPMALLFDHPRVVAEPVPTSAGGAEQAALQGDANAQHSGDPSHDTADFSDWSVGNLRLDYVLPSAELTIEGNGVFWPSADEPSFEWVGTHPFPVSDHRLVWADLAVVQP